MTTTDEAPTAKRRRPWPYINYAWIIDTDLIWEAGDPGGSDAGRIGPRMSDPALFVPMQEHPEIGKRFRMYDADGILYYEGRFRTGEGYVSTEADGLEPLTDFGEGNAGCTDIRYLNADTGQWESLMG